MTPRQRVMAVLNILAMMETKEKYGTYPIKIE